MDKKKTPQCPKCKTRDNVYLFDRGYKLFFRTITGNNRFACLKCKISWRRKNPSHFVKLKRAQ